MKKALSLAVLFLALAGTILAAPAAIKVVKDPAELPQPFAQIARVGDIFVSGGRYAAVIAAAPRTLWSSINYGHPDVAGYIAAFLPAGRSARPDVQVGYPYFRLNGKLLVPASTSLKIEGSAVVARAACAGPRRRSSSTSSSATLSPSTPAGSTSPRRSGTPARPSSRASARASARPPGRATTSALTTPNPSPRSTSASMNAPTTPWPGSTRTRPRPPRSRSPARSARAKSIACPIPCSPARPSPTCSTGSIAPSANRRSGPRSRSRSSKGRPRSSSASRRRAPSSSARSSISRSRSTIPLPAGTYQVRANLFPATVERTVVATAAAPGQDAKGAAANAWTIEAPAFGRLRVAVADRKGRHVPGKVSFIGLAPTATPYFLPVDPIDTGRSWETLKNEVYPPADGVEVILPAGTYLATSSRGPEFSVETRVVEVLSGEPRDLRFTIDRALETPGLVSVDSHMHTQFSDGSVLVPQRVRSAVAEGIDVVFSADHNTVIDYGPDIARLGLGGELAFIPGVEVTARTGSIHFNSLPVGLRPDEPNGGAISVRDETPAKLFALARAKDPGSLVHLNHPRSGTLGYFNNYHLDPEKAAFADALFDLDFEVMEALNGAKFDRDNRRAIEDWFHLLNRGYPIRIVATSDAHGIDGGETGYARTYVLMAEPVAGAVDEKALVAALKKGRAFVSNGPVVTVRANGKATFGDMVKAKKGRVDLAIAVTGAPWLDVSEVRLIVNGERRPPLPIKGADGRTVKFRDRVKVDVPGDGWIAVEVLGGRSLYPLIQQRSGDGRPEEAARPYALTNPILVDANGDGRSDPVWPEKVVVK